jgi:hypothetical protein
MIIFLKVYLENLTEKIINFNMMVLNYRTELMYLFIKIEFYENFVFLVF